MGRGNLPLGTTPQEAANPSALDTVEPRDNDKGKRCGLPPIRRPAVSPPSRRGLSRVEAAQYIGVSPSTFDKMISDGIMPGPKRIYSRTVWDRRALDLAFEALGSDEPPAVSPFD